MFFQRSYKNYLFSDFEQDFIGMLVTIEIHVSRELIEEQTVSCRSICLHRCFQKSTGRNSTFSDFWQNFRQRCYDFIQRVQGNIWETKVLLRNNSFLNLASGFRREVFDTLVAIALHVTKQLLRKNVFWKKYSFTKSFWISVKVNAKWWKSFGRVVKIDSICPKELQRNYFFFEKVFNFTMYSSKWNFISRRGSWDFFQRSWRFIFLEKF